MSWAVSDNKPTVRSLCREWEDMHRLPIAREGTRAAFAILPLMFLADVFVLDPADYAAFMLPRLAVVALLLVNLALLRVAPKTRGLGRWVMLSPLLAIVVCQSYFLFLPLPQYRVPIILAHMVVAFFGSIFMHRFWREQYAFNGFSMVLYAALAVALPAWRTDLASLVNVEIASVATMYVLRRDFFETMHQRYHNLCMFLPRPIARLSAIARDGKGVMDAFAPARRFVVCLCADWRDFQVLAAAKPPEFISQAFASYYDLVLKRLDAACPSGHYFVDWNADELFVVFFSEPAQADRCAKEAFTMASALAHELADEARQACGFDLVYDIGVAAGFGLIGLMGPTDRRKTTVAAEAAGTAKRLEGEAKRLRRALGVSSHKPVVVLEPELREVAIEHGRFAADRLVAVVAEGKDVDGRPMIAYQDSDAWRGECRKSGALSA